MRSSFLRTVASALAHRVVRGYPQPWRDRYEGEVLALLEDSPARLRDVVDLTRGLVVERARATFEPGDRPTLSTALVAVGGMARAGAVMAVPIIAGWVLRWWLGPVPRSVSFVVMLLNLAVSVALVFLLTRGYPPTAVMFAPFESVLSRRAGVWWTGILLMTIFLVSWALPGASGVNLFVLAIGPVNQMSTPHRTQELMARSLHGLRTVRNEMKWALLELQRCERLVAGGAAAPLEEARETVVRLTRQREEALATLHGLGYRATLRTARTPNLEHSNSEPNQNTN